MRSVVLVLLIQFGHLVFAQNYVTVGEKAMTAYSEGRYDDSILLFKRSIALAELNPGKVSEGWAQVANSLGLVYQALGKYDESIVLLEEVAEVRKEVQGPNHEKYGQVCFALGMIYQYKSSWEKSIQHLKEAARVSAIYGHLNKYYIPCRESLTALLQHQKRYSEALPISREIMNAHASIFGKKSKEYLESAKYLAAALQKAGEYAELLPLLEEIKTVHIEIFGENDPDYDAVGTYLASTYIQLGMTEKAIDELEIAIPIMEKKDLEAEVIAQSYSAMADLKISMNDLPAAEKILRKSLKLLNKEPDKNLNQIATGEAKMALIFFKQGLLDQAETKFNEALSMTKKAGSIDEQAYIYNGLSGLKTIQENLDEAIHFASLSSELVLESRGESSPDYFISLQGLAVIHMWNKDFTEARKILKIVDRLLLKYSDDVEEIFSFVRIKYYQQQCWASFFEENKMLKEAEERYLRAYAIVKENYPENSTDYLKSLEYVSKFYLTEGLYEKSEPWYLERNEKLLFILANNINYLSEKERQALFEDFGIRFESFNTLVVNRYQERPELIEMLYNQTLAVKGFLMESTNKIRDRVFSSGNKELKALYKNWLTRKEQLAFAYSNPSEDMDVKSIESQVNEIEKQLANYESIANQFNPKQVSWGMVRDKLKPNQAAIEIIRARYLKKDWTDSIFYLALIVKPEAQRPELVIMKNGNQMEGPFLNRYRSSIKYKLDDKKSYESFWKPIAEKLDGIKKVFLAPDGIYHSLSLDGIKNPDTGKFIADEIKIEAVPNTKSILKNRIKRIPNREAKLIGFPDYNGSMYDPSGYQTLAAKAEIQSDTTVRFFDGDQITELPGTLKEINSISQLLTSGGYQVENFTESAASEETIRSFKSPSILHIATHGFFLKNLTRGSDMLGISSDKVIENPLFRSGLLLSGAKNAIQKGGDGVLTAFEVSNMNLTNTDLVVLSACETGLGEIKNGEGVYGLQRAFQSAGASSILMSLWTVSDEATQQLMTSFYENWITKQMSKRDAFDEAKKSLRTKYDHPYYWAAFVLIGN